MTLDYETNSLVQTIIISFRAGGKQIKQFSCGSFMIMAPSNSAIKHRAHFQVKNSLILNSKNKIVSEYHIKTSSYENSTLHSFLSPHNNIEQIMMPNIQKDLQHLNLSLKNYHLNSTQPVTGLWVKSSHSKTYMFFYVSHSFFSIILSITLSR